MDFSSALTQRADEVQRPSAMPAGFYNFQISGAAEMEEFTARTTGDTFQRIRFPMTCVAAVDVDEADLAAFGNVTGERLSKSFMFNTTEGKEKEMERSIFNLKRFLVDHCAMSDDKTLEELIAEAPGNACLAEVTHRADSNDPEIVYAEIGKTALID